MKEKPDEQPEPVTPGITKAMVRAHVFEVFRDRLPEHPLTLSDWVLAEKELVQQRLNNDALSSSESSG